MADFMVSKSQAYKPPARRFEGADGALKKRSVTPLTSAAATAAPNKNFDKFFGKAYADVAKESWPNPSARVNQLRETPRLPPIASLNMVSAQTARPSQASNASNARKPRHFGGHESVKIGKGGISVAFGETREADGELKQRELVVGALIWRAHLVPHTPFEGQEEWRIVKRASGAAYYDKGRFWCLVAAHKTKVSLAPMFSYKDKGLSEKDPRYCRPLEYLNVRPKDCPKALYKKQVSSMPTLEIEIDRGRPFKISRTTTVLHFCAIKTVDKEDTKGALLSGYLTPESSKLLPKYAARAMLGIYGPTYQEDETT